MVFTNLVGVSISHSQRYRNGALMISGYLKQNTKQLSGRIEIALPGFLSDIE